MKVEKRSDDTQLWVQRITVDEILADDLIRFEICDLKEEVTRFRYEINVWKNDLGVVVQGDMYELDVGIPFPWDELREGHVFLFGTFDVIGPCEDPEAFHVHGTHHRFLRIDHLDGFRDHIRRLYSDVLRGGTRRD